MFDTENCGNPNCEACNPRTARRAGRDEGVPSLGDILSEAIEKRQREIGERMRRILNGENFSVPSVAAEGIPSLGDILREAMAGLEGVRVIQPGDMDNDPLRWFSDSERDEITGRRARRMAESRQREQEAAEVARQRKASATVDDNLQRATRRVQQARKALVGANPMLRGAARVDLERLRRLIDNTIAETY